MTLTDKDYEKINELLGKKSFVNALYAEIGFISIFADTVARRADNNDIYDANLLDVVTIIFGMGFLGGLFFFTAIFCLITFFSTIKRIAMLITGVGGINLRKLEELSPKKAMSALLPTLLGVALCALLTAVVRLVT